MLSQGAERYLLLHNFAKMRKIINNIWSINNVIGEQVNCFNDMSKEGTHNFKQHFNEAPRTNIIESVKMDAFFPRFLY